MAHTRARIPFTRRRQEEFLVALATGLSIADAAAAAGVGRRTVYRHRLTDRTFAESWTVALDCSVDAIEERLRRIVMGGRPDSMATVRAAEVLLRGRSSRHR